MSFFLQTERKTNLQKTGTPSPCQYQAISKYSQHFAHAPFGSTQPLNRVDKSKNHNPQKIEQGQQVFMVNDMNIKIRSQQQISSVFKSGTSRFNDIPVLTPGPSQYDVVKQRVNKTKSYTQFPNKYPVGIKPTVPSIPVDNLGFKEDDNNEMKKVNPPKIIPPFPGSYELRTALQPKGVVIWKAQKPTRKQTESLPGPGQYNNNLRPNKSLTSCFNSESERFGHVKIKQQKKPGPGYYNFQNKSKISHNMSTEGNFNSKTARFQKQVHELSTGPGMYFNDLNQKKKSLSYNNIRKFHKQQPVSTIKNRKSIFEGNLNPGPGEYRTNFGISYQLHKALLKKQVANVLPRSKRTIFQVKEDDSNLGPCTYQPQYKKSQSKGKLWKKTEVVNLKVEEQYTPSPMQYSNFYNTIQAKVKHMNSKLTLTEEKPFNSGAQRFKHYPNIINAHGQRTEDTEQSQPVEMVKVSQGKKVKKLIMTSIKVKVPFGISSNKYEQKTTSFQGPDFYNKPMNWVKQTFNIKGKLQ